MGGMILLTKQKCHKQQYTTQRAAWRAMSRIIANATTGPVPVREYYCNDCRAWHLTSKPRVQKYAHREKGNRRGRSG